MDVELDSVDNHIAIVAAAVVAAVLLLSQDPSLVDDRSNSLVRRIDRRTLPFVGIRRIVNPGGPTFALQATQIVLDADNESFKQQFRMSKACFYSLEGWYASNTDLKDTRYQTRAQKLLIFLWTLAFDEP